MTAYFQRMESDRLGNSSYWTPAPRSCTCPRRLYAPIQFHPADRHLSDLAADFKSRHRISLADAYAAALANDRKAELVTGDQGFKAVEKEIRIRWLKA